MLACLFFLTEVDAKQRLIVWLNGLEYHVYNRSGQSTKSISSDDNNYLCLVLDF